MTLTQLANYVRIVELRSLSKAAAVVRIAQPALSRQVRALEAELGTLLLVRHAGGVTPTAAGEVLLARARRLLLEAEGARDAVRALAEEPGGRIALGVPASMSTTLLPPLISALQARYPRLRPYLVDGFSAALHARTLAGDLDLAILYEDRSLGPLASAPLLSEDLMLVGPPQGERPPGAAAQMLAGRPLVLPARPNRLRLIIDGILPPDHDLRLEVDSLPAIVGLVAAGAGYTVLPYSTVAAEVARGALRTWDLRSPQLSRTLLLVRPLDRRPTGAVAAVEKEIRRLVQAMAGALRWRPLAAPAE